MNKPSEQRVAVITGASRGIGEEAAYRLAEQGRHVVLVGRQAETLAMVQARIEAAGGEATVMTCDIADGPALTRLIDEVGEKFGRVDILVNNAGMTWDGLLLKMSDEQFDQVINLNLRSAFVSCRAATRWMMRNHWGRIINVSSVAGVIGNAGQANYSAAKAGLIGLTKTIAKEFAGRKITANVVAPGFVDTRMTNHLDAKIKEHACSQTPMGRFGQPEEIASAIAYFASEQATYTTGQVLCVDGGMTML